LSRIRIIFFSLLAALGHLAYGQVGGGGGTIPVRLNDFGYSKFDFLNNIEATKCNVFWMGLPGKLPLIEYQEGAASTDMVAYRRGSDIDLEITFKNYDHDWVTFTFMPKRVRMTCPGQVNYTGSTWTQSLEIINLQAIQEIQGPFTIPLFGTKKVTFKIRDVPNYVSVGDLELDYELPCFASDSGPYLCENGTNGNYAKFCRLFLLLDIPTGLQSLPWLDIAEYGCRWAWGANDTTSTYERMVSGIYAGGRAPYVRMNWKGDEPLFLRVRRNNQGPYDPSVGLDLAAWYDKAGPPFSGPETAISMKCDDFSTLLWTMLELNGISSFTSIISVPNRDLVVDGTLRDCLGQIGTQPLKGAGSTSYTSKTWNYHSPVYGVSKFFDASAAYYYDSDGIPWLNPDYIGWTSPYYFHNFSTSHGGLADSESWVYLDYMVHPAGNTSTLTWLSPYIQNINPSLHVHPPFVF
jgi:hypothetical protein